MTKDRQEYIGIDVGEKRIGLARINSAVGIAEALAVLDAQSEYLFEEIYAAAQKYEVSGLVVGLARGLDGQETAQTAVCRQFAQNLKDSVLNMPVYLVDEAGSSLEADERIRQGVAGMRDSIAAGVILENFLTIRDKAGYEVPA